MVTFTFGERQGGGLLIDSKRKVIMQKYNVVFLLILLFTTGSCSNKQANEKMDNCSSKPCDSILIESYSRSIYFGSPDIEIKKRNFNYFNYYHLIKGEPDQYFIFIYDGLEENFGKFYTYAYQIDTNEHKGYVYDSIIEEKSSLEFIGTLIVNLNNEDYTIEKYKAGRVIHYVNYFLGFLATESTTKVYIVEKNSLFNDVDFSKIADEIVKDIKQKDHFAE